MIIDVPTKLTKDQRRMLAELGQSWRSRDRRRRFFKKTFGNKCLSRWVLS
ncbi:MAG: hypothetical protein IPP09_09450 [Elusimicrobia bacterium]|nr:hypothetical protein [Elusimicrobiota bacterium]